MEPLSQSNLTIFACTIFFLFNGICLILCHQCFQLSLLEIMVLISYQPYQLMDEYLIYIDREFHSDSTHFQEKSLRMRLIIQKLIRCSLQGFLVEVKVFGTGGR